MYIAILYVLKEDLVLCDTEGNLHLLLETSPSTSLVLKLSTLNRKDVASHLAYTVIHKDILLNIKGCPSINIISYC